MLKKEVQKKYLYGLIGVIMLFELFFIFFLSRKRRDTFIVLFCLLAQINLLIALKNEKVKRISFSHFMFGASLFIIPILTHSIWLLIMVLSVIVITKIFRYKNGMCPLTTFDKNLVDYSFGGRIDWDYMYALFGFIAMAKMIYVYQRTNK